MTERVTVARYDDAGGLSTLERAVSDVCATPVSGVYVKATVTDRGDGTAVVSASGPSDLVNALIDYVDMNY